MPPPPPTAASTTAVRPSSSAWSRARPAPARTARSNGGALRIRLLGTWAGGDVRGAGGARRPLPRVRRTSGPAVLGAGDGLREYRAGHVPGQDEADRPQAGQRP